jgi:hypothetical protein
MGLEIYASLAALLFFFGPMAVSWPSSIWLIYPRFGVIALVLVLLLPRCDLRGWAGAVVALLGLIPIAFNASLNAEQVRNFSEWARPYDSVRAQIPPHQRVLAVTAPDDHIDPPIEHNAILGLQFYLMVDGASYVAQLFDKPELPVHWRHDIVLRAPHSAAPLTFDPTTHGVDFDYLVLRGSELVDRTNAAGLHVRVGAVGPWTIFWTRAPRRSFD